MKHTSFFLLFFLILCIPVSAKDNAASENKKGIKAYESENYTESANHFRDAVIERPDSPELKFNLGTALSGLNENDEALRQLGVAAHGLEDVGMKAAAHYNAGNTLTASGNLEGAIEEYKKAVRLDQTSGDIRHNLEIAVREWKKQQENKKSENKEENQDGEKKEENKEDKEDSGKKEDNQEDREKEDEGEESETPDQDEQQQQDQEQQQSKQQVNQSQKMTPEEAMRILDALNDEEKKALSLRRSQMKTDVQQGDDW